MTICGSLSAEICEHEATSYAVEVADQPLHMIAPVACGLADASGPG